MAAASTAAQGLGMSSEAKAGGGSGGRAKEQDHCLLPIFPIARIMRRAVPAKGKISKDAQECVQECASEFISFSTSEASHYRCEKDGRRKTINGDDIISTMAELGFDDYIEPLIIYLKKYREQKQI